MTSFTGFGPKALAFFEALKFHQDKAWFEENRGLYDSDVLEPMVALEHCHTSRRVTKQLGENVSRLVDLPSGF